MNKLLVPTWLHKTFGFLWLVIIGTNVAGYYSEETPYQGVIILMGAAYFFFFFQKQILRLVFFKDYLFFLSVLIIPIFLMLLSDRSFERSVYTSQISIVLVFVVASVLALRADLNWTLTIASFVIVLIGVATNLYEFFVENNMWSISPGRSAGFYINPNISGGALIGYGLMFFSGSSNKLKTIDLFLMAIIAVGVFTTFSRTSILAALLFFAAVILMRVETKNAVRILFAAVAIPLLAFFFATEVFQNINLSQDAMIRIYSLIEKGGIGDYQEGRGYAAQASLDLAMQYPVFGVGVRTIYEMQEGPHNMFIAMMVDYGLFGLVIYLIFIFRLIYIAYSVNRKLAERLWFFIGWLCIFSLSSHNLLGDTATMPLFGFTLAHAFQLQSLKRLRQVDR